MLIAYQARLNDLKRDTRLIHALIFKNKGARAGASLPHAHSQLIVTPIVPITIQEELNGAMAYFNFRGRSIFHDMLVQERTSGTRVIAETSQFLVFCPFASRFPFETWIVPKTQRSHYEKASRSEIDELGEVLKKTLRKLEIGLEDPATTTSFTRPRSMRASCRTIAGISRSFLDWPGLRGSSGAAASTSTPSRPKKQPSSCVAYATIET